MGNYSQLIAMSGIVQFVSGLVLYVVPVLAIVLLWRRLKVRPSSLSLRCGFILLGISVLASVLTDLEDVWWLALAVFGGLLVFDLLLLLRVKRPTVERVLPTRFASGEPSEVELVVLNHSRMKLDVRVFDGLPESGECDEMPWVGSVAAGMSEHVFYPLKILQRGLCEVAKAHLEYSSPLRLWNRQIRAGESQQTRVYPNYEPVVQFALLAMAGSPEQMGAIKKNRAGLSKDFHQLRDYQLGDTLSKVDWKATARKLQLVSRDYQEVRDQNVILAVDCGQRMRAMDGDIAQFDHCLNAMLLLAYVALKQGDSVGVMAFGGEDRWLPPVKGLSSMTTILNHLYDYQTTPAPSDYAAAAERLMVCQSRRSLVVFLSNVRGEDGADLVEPLRMLRRKHVIILANLREQEVMERLVKPVETLDDALAVGASQRYLDEREAVLKELGMHGVLSVDETAQHMPVALANAYLAAREGV